MTETSRKTNLEFGVQNNTKAGLSEIKQGVASVGEAAAQAGAKAGAAFDGMGKSSDGAATKIDKSTQGIIRSIEREVAAMEAGGKSTAAYYESIAKQRGADMNALGPYLQQMRLAEKQAEQALGTMGMSAKQTAAAMRGVPAQFTDIFVSLQGGQAPLTVFLQQGGQLKDMFGGAGNAAKALGSYVLGLVNPFTVAAAAVVALGAAYYQGSQEQDAFVKAIVLSGNASGMTSTQLQLLAADLGVVVGSQGRAAEALTEFVRAGVEGSDSLKEYAQAAIDWEKATGTAVADTAKAFAKLQEDPLKAAMELHKGMNFLTAATYEQIRALEEQGDKQAAAKVASDAYKDAINAGSNQIKDNLGYLEGAWRKLGNTASKVWDLMLGAGRAATVADKMGGLRDDIAAMEKQLAEGKGFGNTAGGAATGRGNAALTQQDIKLLQERITLRKQELSTLEQTAKAEKDAAEQKAKEGELVKARDEWNQRGLKFLTDEQKLARALKEERLAGIKAGASEEEIAKRLDAVRESMAKKTKGLSAAERARNKELSDQGKLIGELSGLSSTFTKDWNNLTKAYARGALSLSDLEKSQAALLAKQPFAVALAKEEAEATNARVKAYEEEVKTQDKLLKQRQDAAQKAQEAVQKAKDEEEAYAYAAAAGITLAEAVAHIALARAEDNYQKGLAQGLDAQTLLALQQERDARRELIGVMAQKGVREANKKAQDQIVKDWEKLSETVGRTLADYIMGGGKDAATYLKRLFSTLVLQPIVQTAVGGIMGTGAAGVAGIASGGGGGIGGLLNTASNIKTLMGLSGSGAALGSLGISNAVGMAGGDALGALISTNATNWGVTAGSSMLGTIGAALPWIAGGLAIASLFGGDLFNKSTPHMGAAAVYKGGEVSRGWMPEGQFQEEMFTAIGGIAQSIGSALDATAESFGKKAGYTLSTVFSDDTSKDKAFGGLSIIGPDGQKIADWSGFDQKWGGKRFSDGEAGYKEYLAALAGDVKTAFMAMDLPGWSDQLIEAATDLDSLNQALQGVSSIKASFDALGRSMEMFSGISGELQTALLETAGSMDTLLAGANAFYQGFYSEQERMEALQKQLRDTLTGLDLSIDPAMGDSAKEQFRAAVEAAMATGQAELAAKLLAMSGAFAQTADYATKLFDDVAAKAAEAAKTVESQMTSAFNAMTSAGDLLDKIDGALGGSGNGYSLLREQRLWASMAAADYKQQIELAGQLTDMVLSRYQLEQQNAQKLLDFGKSLRSYVDSLKIGGLSPLTTAEKLAEAAKQYADTLFKAQGGDESAMGALQGISSSYLDLARQYFASSGDYTKIFNSVTGSLDALGVSSQTEAQLQLDVSSQSLSQLRQLQGVVQTAYGKADTDFGIQKDLLQQQINQMLRTANGIEAVRDLLAGMPAELSTQLNGSGSAGPGGGGIGSSSFAALAQSYVDLLGGRGSTDVGYVSAAMSHLDYANWQSELNNAMALLTDAASRQQMQSIFDSLAKLNGLGINGSHANGLGYVPFDGYIAQLHRGERVLTAQENQAYQVPVWSNYGMGDGMAAMAAEIKSLNARIDRLTEQNERLMTAQIRATVESNQDNAERVVQGVGQATERAAYAKTIQPEGYK